MIETVFSQNLEWVSDPETWGMIPSWEDNIWSTEAMALSLLYKGFLIGLPVFLYFIIHGILW